MALVTDEDELNIDDEEQQRRRQAAQGTIGSMPRPNPSSVPVPEAMPAPEVGATSAPPDASTIAGVAPYKSPSAPRPQSQAFTDWQASDLAQHPTNGPRYHGLARVGDTIAGATNIGTAIERAGEIGTQGAEAKAARLAGNAALENTQIGYGETERENEAKIAEQAARAETERKGGELVDVPLPGGGTTQVLRKNVATPTAAIINSAERGQAAETGANARRDVAETNAGAKEETAKIMVGGRALGTKEVVSSADNKPHVMMWNPNTHTYDKDLGLAPPKQAASSAYANTRTVQLLDPETGVPTVYQYNAETNSYDKQVGTSATGAYGHEMAQAGAVERSGKDVIAQLHDPDNRAILGQLSSYIAQGTLGTPLADQRAAFLSAQLKTFAALQPAMHGFRARSAQEAFEKIVGGLAQDPDATIASIEGILRTAQAIKPNTAPKAPGAPAAPTNGGAGGGKVIKYDNQGNRIQ